VARRWIDDGAPIPIAADRASSGVLGAAVGLLLARSASPAQAAAPARRPTPRRCPGTETNQRWRASLAPHVPALQQHLFVVFPSARLRWTGVLLDQSVKSGFTLKRVRLELAGWIGPGVYYNIAGDFASPPPGTRRSGGAVVSGHHRRLLGAGAPG